MIPFFEFLELCYVRMLLKKITLTLLIMMHISSVFKQNLADVKSGGDDLFEEQAYVGLLLPFNKLGGTFNGIDALVGSGLYVPLPKLKDELGWGFIFGIQPDWFYLVETRFVHSKHSGTFDNLSRNYESKQNLFSCDAKVTPVKKFSFDTLYIWWIGLGMVKSKRWSDL